MGSSRSNIVALYFIQSGSSIAMVFYRRISKNPIELQSKDIIGQNRSHTIFTKKPRHRRGSKTSAIPPGHQPTPLLNRLCVVLQLQANKFILICQAQPKTRQGPHQSPSGTRSPGGISSPGAQVSKALGVMVSPA